ncbi:pilus assembly protein [Anaeromyxobacter oryzisoli]|uniref:pilus assembly protein PilY n=1 Tax=Anaeromyxobacter oryzisoli TaxID=2925408 RepID=UPI001F57CF28|nr:pilus assembly protein PilY [Anaeromyxobacter sp. SG63]
MRRTALRIALVLAAAVLLSTPHAGVSGTCSNSAARNLLAGGATDALLNPPWEEDNAFFSSQAGYPNIFFVVGTADSMARLPPNGPAYLGATGSPIPTTGIVGCGQDTVSSTLSSNAMLAAIAARVYHSPCGKTTLEGLAFAGQGTDYAAAAGAVCPYYTPSNTFALAAGFDPDFYASGTGLTVGSGAPNLFPKDLVFHDNAGTGTAWARTGNLPGDHNYGDGWSFTAVHPYQTSTQANGNNYNWTAASIAQFCADQGTAQQGTQSRQDICNACLSSKGWYYDGTVRTATVDGASVSYPSIWYTGNYLNFFPPKFVIARKVVKDVIASQSRIRMAMAQFGSNDYKFISDFNPSCQSVFGGGNWESNRSTYVNDVNALAWGGTSPLSKALFDVGRYYHTPSLPWFGQGWAMNGPGWSSNGSANQLAVCWSCQQSNVIILTDGQPSPNDGADLPPGTSSIADSNSGKYAGDAATGVLGASLRDCPRCGYFTGADDYKNNLTRVAFYLHNYDLRSEPAGACGGTGTTLDGRGNPGKQTLTVYTVGFGTGAGDATRILSDAATIGGGIAVRAQAADELRSGIYQVFADISSRSTSFSVATVSTLQTAAGNAVIVPRFAPSRDSHWPGHLYRYEMYSEFVNACAPGGAGDLDCDGSCTSTFLQDKDGHFIAEDGDGNFVQLSPNLPACAQTPKCVAAGKPCGALTNVPANPWWDAYQTLQNQTWKTRTVWTALDDAAPAGTIDSHDSTVRLEATDTFAQTLLPYLGLGTTGTACATLAQKIETAGDPVTAQVMRTSKLECAKEMIRFVLGADVLNEAGRLPGQGWPAPTANGLPATLGDPTTNPPTPPNLPNQDLLLDRPFKLGDIYHSSPVVVDAPLPYDGILCPNGLHNQCLDSLWRTPVKMKDGINQYDRYSKSSLYQYRRKMVLVGANDGLLHAFNGGRWHANPTPGQHNAAADDPATSSIDESLPPYNGYYDRGDADGPVELWAFLPPDLLGKIPALFGNDHQLFVDGTAMVRDVWVDGQANGMGIAAHLDDVKEAAEFHTVAVVGERRGGTHYFALDVTDAAKLPSENAGKPAEPKFLWIYPEPSDPESLQFGETYTDFLPVPPPVGPVRIQADSTASQPEWGMAAPGANTPVMTTGLTSPVQYHERWVTLLPGGVDPQSLRGRGVHMVDVWTGKELFDFSYPSDPTTAAANDPRRALTFPVAATPAMVMWGQSTRRQSLGFENDGYFDTATFGDTGGQLWVLRFNVPGQLGTNGKVGNWFGARVFQMGETASPGSLCATRGGQPFYYITENTALAGSHIYRVYAGTGDRFNILDTNGGICGPTNLRACAQHGCTVSLDPALNALAATDLGTDARGLAQGVCQSDFTALPATANPSGTGPSCGTIGGANISVSSCPSVSSGAGSFTKDVTASCSADADGDYGCTRASSTSGVASYGSKLDLTTATTAAQPASRNWFFSFRVFEDTGKRSVFKDAAGAADYDNARYFLSDTVTASSPLTASYTASAGIVVIDGAATNPTPLATADSNGWALFYDHGPTVVTEGHTFNVNPLDERTSSVSSLYSKLIWNTIQPALSEATSAISTCAQSKCTAAYRRLNYLYGADPVTGGPVLTDSSGALTRTITRTTLVTPGGLQPTVFVNGKGQIAVGQTGVPPEQGATNLPMTSAMDPVMGLGTVEVSRDLHACRHAVDAAAAAAACR